MREKEIEIPINIIIPIRIIKESRKIGEDFWSLLRKSSSTVLIFLLILSQAPFFGAFEAHIISVTATIESGLADYLVINKVYYDVDEEHGREPKNEWIELYNPTDQPINLKNWQICDKDQCDVINPNVDIPAFGFALISHDASTWQYWDIPNEVVKIHQLGGQFFDLDNSADMLILKDPDGNIVDQMNWGSPDTGWLNYNSGVWNPGVPDVAEGHLLGRVPDGFDTDKPSDFRDLGLPEVQVTYPNGGEMWHVGGTYTIEWLTTNPNGPDEALGIDIFYSRNSGVTWANIVRGTENDGAYDWTVPLFLDGYFVPSRRARIKVVAIGPENFMVHDWDMSDEDFCPPIDFRLLRPIDLELIKELGLMKLAERFTPERIMFNQELTIEEITWLKMPEIEPIGQDLVNPTNKEDNFVELTPEERLIPLTPEEGGLIIEEIVNEIKQEIETTIEEQLETASSTLEIASSTEEMIEEAINEATSTEEVIIEATATEEIIVNELEAQADEASEDIEEIEEPEPVKEPEPVDEPESTEEEEPEADLDEGTGPEEATIPEDGSIPEDSSPDDSLED